jgi:hypothetical protein
MKNGGITVVLICLFHNVVLTDTLRLQLEFIYSIFNIPHDSNSTTEHADVQQATDYYSQII